MSVSKSKSHWWSPGERLAESSYFRQHSQKWTSLTRRRAPPESADETTETAGDTASIRPTYKVYWTKGIVAESEQPVPQELWSMAEYHTLDDALGWARQINRTVGVCWLISCPSGPTMTRSKIEEILRKREATLAIRPRARAVR
jgi:hypothetical protein